METVHILLGTDDTTNAQLVVRFPTSEIAMNYSGIISEVNVLSEAHSPEKIRQALSAQLKISVLPPRERVAGFVISSDNEPNARHYAQALLSEGNFSTATSNSLMSLVTLLSEQPEPMTGLTDKEALNRAVEHIHKAISFATIEIHAVAGDEMIHETKPGVKATAEEVAHGPITELDPAVAAKLGAYKGRER